MSIFAMIAYIKKYYKTINGIPVENCNDSQIVAVYHALQNRQNKKSIETRYK